MDPRTVTTSGTGVAQAAPDAVAVALVIETEGSTTAEALEACGALQTLVSGALGVRASAGGLSVQPSWDHERNRPGKPVATSRITVRLPGLAEAGHLVTAALESGGRAVRLESLSPVVSDPSEAAVQARSEAFAAARSSAEQYAALAGMRLGACLQVQEGARGAVVLAEAAMSARKSLQVADGAQDITASVTVTWELAD